MQCMRRPDLDPVTRVHMAAQALLSLGVYGELTRRANAYRVSRLFVSKLLWQLQLLYELEACDPGAPEAMRTEVDRHLLLLRLEGHGALERLSQILRQLGLPVAAVGSMSQRLAAYARALPHEEWTGAQSVFLWGDALFPRGQPLLITVEPRSLAIVKIALAKNREAATWKQHWDALAEAGLIEPHTVVSDPGSGLVKGWTLMGLTHHPDVLPLLRPLAIGGERLYRKALAASAREYERGSLAVGRSEAVITKRRVAYEAAKAEADEQSRR